MSIPQPHESHSEDARPDQDPPTDAITDDVRADSVEEEVRGDQGKSTSDAVDDAPTFRPAQTHP